MRLHVPVLPKYARTLDIMEAVESIASSTSSSYLTQYAMNESKFIIKLDKVAHNYFLHSWF